MLLKKFISDFKPHKMGYTKVFGELEAEVMKLIWAAGSATVREIYDVIHQEKGLAYTTVMTIMSRLADKGILRKQPQGNAFVYFPEVTEKEFADMVVTEVLDGLLDEFAEPAISHMIEKLGSEDISRLERLEQIIKERRLKGGS
ncbi:MAG: CopY family transcriptional regulator [Firmicutes bacterium HGW-Firmicutes-14]|nr:MAG: CopY family transcriptional regulator [Firmicutes bacterium HGW-Firmicutes-14]